MEGLGLEDQGDIINENMYESENKLVEEVEKGMKVVDSLRGSMSS